MKIAVIGAGFTGLSAAYFLQKNGSTISIFEKEASVGGLAHGEFFSPQWSWPLDAHYHHLFTNDHSAIDLIKEIGEDFLILSPVTSVLIENQIYRLDSPVSLLKFPRLNIFEKLRVGIVFLIFKLTPRSSLNPFISFLENSTAFSLIPKLIGRKPFDLLFKPLFVSKFGGFADKISALWFWARIKKRTTNLIYPRGGFQTFAEKLTQKIKEKNGEIFLSTMIEKIEKSRHKWQIITKNQSLLFDKILFTAPTPAISRLLPQFPHFSISHLDSLNLILESDAPVLQQTYWLNINDTFPFLAAIQHTNFVDKKNYHGHHVCYLGNYLPADHRYFQLSRAELIDLFIPYLQKINPSFKQENIINSYLVHGKDAQPVVEVGYKKKLPPINLATINRDYQNLFLANMDMVYPWDRGVNYAIELGRHAAQEITNPK